MKKIFFSFILCGFIALHAHCTENVECKEEDNYPKFIPEYSMFGVLLDSVCVSLNASELNELALKIQNPEKLKFSMFYSDDDLELCANDAKKFYLMYARLNLKFDVLHASSDFIAFEEEFQNSFNILKHMDFKFLRIHNSMSSKTDGSYYSPELYDFFELKEKRMPPRILDDDSLPSDIFQDNFLEILETRILNWTMKTPLNLYLRLILCFKRKWK